MIRLNQGLDVRRGRRDADERRKVHTAGESQGFDETGDRNRFAQDDLVAFDDGRRSECERRRYGQPQRAGNTHVVYESLDGWIADDCSVGRPFVGL